MHTLPRPDFRPSVDAVLRQGDEMIAFGRLQANRRPNLSDWYEAETARRAATFDAFANEPITIGDVTITPGEWCDVGEKVRAGYRKPESVRTWRNCRYLGKLKSPYGAESTSLYFERWGAQVTRYPKRDSISLGGIASIARIEPSEKLRKAVAEREEWATALEAARASREAARAEGEA